MRGDADEGAASEVAGLVIRATFCGGEWGELTGVMPAIASSTRVRVRLVSE
jgi:hypothetical protein